MSKLDMSKIKLSTVSFRKYYSVMTDTMGGGGGGGDVCFLLYGIWM